MRAFPTQLNKSLALNHHSNQMPMASPLEKPCQTSRHHNLIQSHTKTTSLLLFPARQRKMTYSLTIQTIPVWNKAQFFQKGSYVGKLLCSFQISFSLSGGAMPPSSCTPLTQQWMVWCDFFPSLSMYGFLALSLVLYSCYLFLLLAFEVWQS